ncbi:hypothetical protein AZE42_14137 [Rhizopogon vesiculosus]|uniref:Uncharacterized protein n=1 Tax=Rhizopogon vesiculosus TaxID=180088 RepID=A0A1J8QCK9_9AGAM|nr:hypothetical protein AZE42_14137 [Rhizopogon vesiculosus]
MIFLLQQWSGQNSHLLLTRQGF